MGVGNKTREKEMVMKRRGRGAGGEERKKRRRRGQKEDYVDRASERFRIHIRRVRRDR